MAKPEPGLNHAAPPHATPVVLCRAELENALCEELRCLGNRATSSGLGLVRVTGGLPLPPAPLMFERQRIPQAGWLTPDRLKPITDDTLDELVHGLDPNSPWTLHAICPPGVQDPRWTRSAGGIAAAILRQVKATRPDLAGAYTPENADQIMQLVRTPDGAWHGVGRVDEGVSPHPGGILRLKRDSRAPSRSFLKLEEAFALMEREPGPGDTVIDLGASPGGWTHACLARGARVTAVDNGPMKIHPDLRNHLRVIRANGITFTPRGADAVDWLVADMLIPPGTAVGLVRRWLGGALCRQAVINIKLPQQHPWKVLQPLLALTTSLTLDWRIAVRNLHHDRREVTLIAVSAGSRPARRGEISPRPRPRSPRSPRRRGR